MSYNLFDDRRSCLDADAYGLTRMMFTEGWTSYGNLSRQDSNGICHIMTLPFKLTLPFKNDFSVACNAV